jgi:uncharacterized membrane protein
LANFTATDMNHEPRNLLSTALAAALALALVPAAQAHGDLKGKERCYGIAKAGQNDCANLSGTHGCAGMAAKNNDPGEWKAVPNGTCKKLKGMTESQAQAKQPK